MSYADIKNKRRGSSIIADGMEKLSREDVLNQTLTLSNVDVINAKDGRCAVLIFAEHPNSFYFGGKVLTEMCEDFLEDEDAMEDLRAGRVKLVLSLATSNSGREYVTYDFVEED
ncbi:MAG: hypothetical protein MR663_07770 [Lachnospiraceae bacterium]|nr:hypothetical protein [Lachnospiraceae bacterium]